MPESPRLFNLDIPRTGFILVYKGGKDWFSHAIKKAQIKEGIPAEDAEYTHTEVCLGGPWAMGALPQGTRVVNIIEKYKGRYVKIMVPLAEDYMSHRKGVAIWAATRCNLPYSWGGVLWFKLKAVLGGKKNWLAAIGDFCSELAGWAINREYLEPLAEKYAMIVKTDYLPREPSSMMPGHFLDLKYFRCEWEGIIR